eukprot:TRINITY_DN4522_c0_g7_i1.p1 TRINITY_DN4522_c0_g7~~TRINITY_DN4522_c0_g7_i1.p1  ORF type:complete len:129 (+),score=16.56 TRINITY_DN4522_c0_g7_i1:73-459(+)
MCIRDRFMQVQSQIRENSMQVRDYLDDLNKWQDEISQKDTKIAKTPSISQAVQQPQKTEQKNTKKYKRDYNTTKDYYEAWDKFDAVRLWKKCRIRRRQRLIIKPPTRPLLPQPPRHRVRCRGRRQIRR